MSTFLLTYDAQAWVAICFGDNRCDVSANSDDLDLELAVLPVLMR